MQQVLPNPRRAISAILMASVLVAGTMLLAKLLTTDALGPALHPLQVSHARFVFAFLTIAGLVAITRPAFDAPHLRLHLGRTLLGWLGVSCMFASVRFIPLADATAISFLNPVFGMVYAVLFLRERTGPVRWIAAGIAFLGGLILLRPGMGAFQFGALLALAAAMATGLEIVFIKLLSGRQRPTQILLTNNALGLVIASLAVIPFWAAPTPRQWPALVAIGVVMIAAQSLYIQALRYADAGLVLPFSYATLIFATLYDALLFAVVPDWISWLGAGVIVTGAALLAWREGLARRSAPEP